MPDINRSATGAGLITCVAMLSLAAGALLPRAAHAQPVVMKFSTQTQNDMQHEYIKVYKTELEKRTNNRITVEVYPGAQLGSQQRQSEGLRIGSIEAAIGPAELFAGVDPRFQVLAMAGLYKDVEHARRVLDAPAVRKAVADIAASRQLVNIGLNIYDLQSFVFKTPVSKLADFSGKRIRVLASQAEQESVKALGGAPVPMSFGEIIPGLQQGTIDGVASVLGVWVALRYYDVAPHMLDTRLWGIVPVVMVSKVWFDRLPPDLQQAVRDTAVAIEPEMHKWQLARVASDLNTWVEKGGKAAKLPPSEQEEAVRRVSAAIQPVLASHPGMKELYDTLKNAAATAQ
jgi:TRAP-type C4-dicarboxylate transport system substrate-binding protein